MNEILTQEKSIYIQISEMIENDILRDILCEEERVPSTNELAKLYAINPATAAKGINILVEAGIVYKKRGIGMFVAKGAKEVIQKKRKDAFYQDYIASMLAEAQSLGITKQELVQMIVKKAFHMANMMHIPVLGLVENFSYLKCPDCGKKIALFGESNIDEVAAKEGTRVLGKLPLDPAYAKAADAGAFYEMENPYLDVAVDALKTI